MRLSKKFRKNDALVSRLRSLAKSLGLILKIAPKQSGAFFYPNSGTIVIGLLFSNGQHYITKEHFCSAFFHELGHSICRNNGTYRNYHSVKMCKKTALRAERYVDKLGEELHNSFLDTKYHRAYRSREDVKWFKQWLSRFA